MLDMNKLKERMDKFFAENTAEDFVEFLKKVGVEFEDKSPKMNTKEQILEWLKTYSGGHLPGDYTVNEVVGIIKIFSEETSLSGNSAGVEKLKMFVSKTTSDSTFVRIVDGEKEYKVEVFDDTICLHVYKSGEKEGSYYENIKSQSPLPTPTNQSDAVGILKELVELKDMKDYLEDVEILHLPEDWNSKHQEYLTRKPLAWEAARKYLQSNPSTPILIKEHPNDCTCKTKVDEANCGQYCNKRIAQNQTNNSIKEKDEDGKTSIDLSLLKELIDMAKDSYTLHRGNGVKDELLQEHRETIKAANYLFNSANKI